MRWSKFDFRNGIEVLFSRGGHGFEPRKVMCVLGLHIREGVLKKMYIVDPDPKGLSFWDNWLNNQPCLLMGLY